MKKIFRKNKKTNLLKHSYRPCDFTQNWSDSEHTQSSQTCNNGRFRMTENLLTLSGGRGQGEGWYWQKALKTATLTLAMSFFITSPAIAQQVPVPTLDKLNKDGVTIPDSDPEQVYPESAYKLTPIENADPENLPQNAITLYDKNDDGTVTPKYYLVNLKDSVTNIGEGDSTKYFEWSQNTEGNLELKEVSAPTEGKTTITVKYDTSSLLQRIPNDADKSSTNISGTFVNQTTGSTSGAQYGGAIYNNGTNAKLGDINADFVGNYVSSTNSFARGGAIYNDEGTIGNITGDFIGNYASSTDSYAYGGAIYNFGDATIGDITGDFIGNYVSGSYRAYGGAIYNFGSNAEIGDITGDFIGNYASSGSGGAIYNDYGDIGDITGDFIGNYASSTNSSAHGGAIYNSGTIGDVTGDFIGNSGGAIYNNRGTIGDVTGDFIGNSGGAIYNYNRTIGDITGDFIGNYESSTNSYAQGGAISNNAYDYKIYGVIGDIKGNFIGNYASSTDSSAYGGAIYNSWGTIGAKDDDGNVVGGIINSSFINNYAKSETDEAKGGAIYTNKSLNIIAQNGGQSVFSGNYVQDKDGKRQEAIYVENNNSAGSTTPERISFEDNKLVLQIKSSYFDSYDPVDLTLNANTNSVIHFDDQISGEIGAVNATYQMNIIGMAENFEGKDDMYADLGLSDDATLSEVVDAYFDYKVEQQFGDDGLPPEYAGQIDEIKGSLLVELIEMGAVETSDPELISSGSIGSYNLKITGDSTGKVVLNNDVINANISLDNTNLYLGREDVFNLSQSLTLNSGSIYLNNNTIGTMHVPTLNLNGNTNISVDADLANKSMDRITAVNYNIKDNAMLNVNNVVLLSDAKEDVTNIQFADDAIKGNVAFTGATPIAYSPIWKYDVSYNPDDGFFSFVRGAASSGNASDAFNPSVLASPVATQAGAYTTQLQTFNYAFQHADTFMNIPYLERVAIINQGKYALSPTGDATDVGTFSPLLLKDDDAGFWVKPYASFENVPLKNGPKVSNINYGTLVGYDSKLTSVGNGFERVLTGYIGYNGASQRYSGVDAYQNGGLLGGTATFYKGNFFNATTLSVGASAGDASTMYGSENYTMLLAGLGNKTGYNFEFFDGGMILQPSMLISYTFVNTFDYNNAAGVRIESDPMHAIQLAPGIKLIGNTKNGWQPYIGVSMVWNLLDESKVTADSVRLPEMSIKPYVQYGVGIQKRFKDKFLAFGQAMIHNGGRNGVSLSAGLRWIVGSE